MTPYGQGKDGSDRPNGAQDSNTIRHAHIHLVSSQSCVEETDGCFGEADG